MTDNSLLQDFIVETAEHLEYTERNLLRLEQHKVDVDVLNDIFRSVHTIKGSSEYLGLDRIAELSHKLESLLDLLRRGERELEVKVIDLLIDTNDRLAQLVDDLSQYQEERAYIDDLVARIEGASGKVTPVSAEEAAGETISDGDWDAIEDEYDEELFGIFVDQLKDSIQGIIDETRKLQSGENPDEVLTRYEDRLGILQSSANYMGYDKLKQVYSQWSQSLAQTTRRINDGDTIDWNSFSQEVTAANIERVRSYFPKSPDVQSIEFDITPAEGIDSQKEPFSIEPLPSDTLEFDDVSAELAESDTLDVTLGDALDDTLDVTLGDALDDTLDVTLDDTLDDTLGDTLDETLDMPEMTDPAIQPELELFSDGDDEYIEPPTKEINPLLADFLVETQEHLDATESNLLRLEQEPDDIELVSEIFRSIHTIKGSSEYLGLDRIAELTHKLESLLDLIRRGDRSSTKEIIDLLISANDRIVQLVGDLENFQVEQTSIDDLLLEIESSLSEPAEDIIESPDAPAEAEILAADSAAPELISETAPEASPEAAPIDTIDEEYDSELFSIFAEQLKDGLSAVCEQTKSLVSEQDIDKTLSAYADRLSTLGASANYMGYENLRAVYDQWSQAVEQTHDDLSKGQKIDWSTFANKTTVEFVQKIKDFFPQLHDLENINLSFDAPQTATPPEIDSVSIIEEEDEIEDDLTTSADQSLLADFIAETKEHIEEVEHNLLKLGESTDNVEVLNDLFRSVHTIKGSSEYLGMEQIAELSHKLENLLDKLRTGQQTADSNLVEILISANDRIGQLVDDLVQYQSEQSDISDLISVIDAYGESVPQETIQEEPLIHKDIDEKEVQVPELPSDVFYEEEYDRELFEIFKKHFNEGIEFLSSQAETIKSGGDLSASLSECKDVLNRLRSSANYMEYFNLKAVYEEWMEQIDNMLSRTGTVEQSDVAQWVEQTFQSNIDRVRSFFAGADAQALFSDQPQTEEIEAFSVESVEPDTEDEEVKAQDLIDAPELEPTQTLEMEAIAEIEEIDTFPKDQDFSATVALDSLDIDFSDDDVLLSTFESDNVDEQDLLSRLENAFDSKIDAVTSGEFSSLSELDVVKELLSDENAPEKIPAMSFSEPDEDKPEKAEPDRRNLDAFLFSDTQRPFAPRKVVPPTPLASLADSPEPSFAAIDEEERSRTLQRGRRRSDRFRERLLRQSIRVDASKVDSLMNQVGELVVTRAGFTQLFSEMHELQLMLKQAQLLDPKEMQVFKELTNKVNAATVSLGRITSELQENVMKVRMLPIAQLFSRYPRVVHDLVRNSIKKVDLDIRGEETELDRMVIEQIADPLIHIIRNAVDHGIEPPDERKRKEKPEIGLLRLEAYHEGNYVVIEIADDGQGIDIEKVRNKAVAKGFVEADVLEQMSPDEVLSLIMLPGFSTVDEVTTTSGRGVGMDVVKDHIEKLNGMIETDSIPGRGTTFRIKIPLTLAIIPALMINVAGEIFTIPLSTVDETIRIHQNEISRIEGLEVYYLRESTLPLIRVADVFKMKSALSGADELFVVVVNTGNRQVGLIVDQLKGREEVVVKPLEDYLQEKSGFSGATILGDGSISLILDVADLVNIAVEQHIRKRKTAVV